MYKRQVYDESGNVRNIHDRKLDALEDLIESANGKPLLVAYWFKHDLSLIHILSDVPDEKLPELYEKAQVL